MLFPANQVMSYFHVFISLLIAIWQAVILVPIYNIHVIALVCQLPSSQMGCVLQQLNSRQNGKFCGHHVESLLGSLMLFSVQSAIIITNLINQAGSYYVITNFQLIWDESQLCSVTQMISLLLHLILALPWCCVMTMISSLLWDISITYYPKLNYEN